MQILDTFQSAHSWVASVVFFSIPGGSSCAAHRSGISDGHDDVPGRVVGLLSCLFGLFKGEDLEQLERHDFDEKTCTI